MGLGDECYIANMLRCSELFVTRELMRVPGSATVRV
jgi:hypothetical protein